MLENTAINTQIAMIQICYHEKSAKCYQGRKKTLEVERSKKVFMTMAAEICLEMGRTLRRLGPGRERGHFRPRINNISEDLGMRIKTVFRNRAAKSNNKSSSEDLEKRRR